MGSTWIWICLWFRISSDRWLNVSIHDKPLLYVKFIICNNDIFYFYREDQISSSRPFYNPDTTSIKAAEGEGCPRCGGKVFAAEQQLAKGTVSVFD